jgi:hypothetical protein
MKINVNEQAARIRKAQVVGEILASAKDAAERGVNNFIYQFKAGERNSFPAPYLNITVEEESEGTVKCAYRGDHGDWCKYVIVR